MSEPLSLLNDAEVQPSTDVEAGFGCLNTERGPLPLRAMNVHARIESLVAEVSLLQTFVNTFDLPLEATYIFPLPDRAAVSRFRLEVGGRVIEGALKERGAARHDYDQAVQQGHRAAIAEEERPGVFTLRVGNLMPGEAATVHVTLTGPLTYSDGEATFRFPLVVASRYIPGTPLPGPSVGTGTALDTDAVPDASRISPPVLLPGFPNPVQLTLTVDVHPGGLPISALRSSLHAVRVEEGGCYRIAVQPGERLNRDFILRFRVGTEAVCSSLLLKPDGPTREGTFLLTLIPPQTAAKEQRPRDLVFVLDRSGSMNGWKMVAARRALARMVDTLTEQDCFTVIAFDGFMESPFAETELEPGSDRQRSRAIEFLSKIEARGGTEMAAPLQRAVGFLNAATTQRDRVLVLVTDGQVGNEDQLLKAIGSRLQSIRVFALGIDQAVNEAFLKRLTALGGGSCEVVESEQRLDEVLAKVHRRIGTPLLTGLQLQAEGVQLDTDSVMPARLPDLFAGSPVVIQGRYRGLPEGTIRVTAEASGRSWSENVVGRIGASEAIPVLWARGHIRDLEDQFVIGHGDRAALERRITETSLRWNVLCRFTAFVAVDRSEVVNQGGQVHQVTQAVEQAAGWADRDFDGLVRNIGAPMGACNAAPAAAPMSPEMVAGAAAPGGRERYFARRARKAPPAEAKAPQKPPSAGKADKDATKATGEDQFAAAKAMNVDKDQIEQLTVDHSLAQAMVEARSISPEEAADHRFRNVLWKYLGSKEVGEGPEVKTVHLTPGDRLLLCSDGLTGAVSDERLLESVRQPADVQSCADGLGQLALDSGSRDNVSCIVMEVAANGALAIGQCCLLGNFRENNEDQIAVQQLPNWTICIVADGMGGQSAGEVASKRATEVILRELQKHLLATTRPEEVPAIIRKAVVQANEEIIAMGALDRDLKNMGTTVVLTVWCQQSSIGYVAGVGDSRCYLIPQASQPQAARKPSFWK